MESKTAIIKDLFHPDGSSAGFYVEEVEGIPHHPDQDIVLKKCSGRDCLLVKPLDQFYRDAKTKDGYASRCKECHIKLSKNYQRKITRNRRAKEYGYSPSC